MRLNWDKPYIINRIWLFDRPNTHADQIISGRLTFSDGSTIKVGELPDDASAAKEVTFSPRKVEWLEFVVENVKPQTQNIGLSEIAVFTAED